MWRGCAKTLLCALMLLAATRAPSARAQDTAAIAGTYCLKGVMEVGSCIRFSTDGRFEYFLAYGAYDENSEGTWRIANGALVLDSPAYDRRPTFAFKRLQASRDRAFAVIVENGAGRGMAGIDVAVTCDGRTREAGYTQEYGLSLECGAAPSAILLSVRMYNLAPQNIDVAGRQGSGRTFVFSFDPGDLGRKRFVGLTVRRDGNDALLMVYAGTPIRELEGRTLRYERSR